jgi:hypothetical protein
VTRKSEALAIVAVLVVIQEVCGRETGAGWIGLKADKLHIISFFSFLIDKAPPTIIIYNSYCNYT